MTTRLPEEYRLGPRDAVRFVEEEIFARLAVHGLAPDSRSRLFARAVSDGIFGGGIYDDHIAEIARGAGANLVVTENRRHFARLLRDEIRVVDSAELAAEL